MRWFGRATLSLVTRLGEYPDSGHDQTMLVFIDESGDPGFSVERGAAPIFVAALVAFESGEAAAQTQAVIRDSSARRLHCT